MRKLAYLVDCQGVTTPISNCRFNHLLCCIVHTSHNYFAFLGDFLVKERIQFHTQSPNFLSPPLHLILHMNFSLGLPCFRPPASLESVPPPFAASPCGPCGGLWFAVPFSSSHFSSIRFLKKKKKIGPSFYRRPTADVFENEKKMKNRSL